MAAMDPNLFPWMSTPPVPGLEGTLGAGAIPQQPAQAPVGSTPGPGFWGTIGQMVGRRPPGPAAGPAPDFASAGGAGMMPFISQSQNVPYFPPPPSAGGGGGKGVGSDTVSSPPSQDINANRVSLNTGGGGSSNSLMDALRGVKAPAPPTPQTVRTPAAPQLAPIGGNNLIPLLTSLGIGPQQFMQMTGMRLGGR